MKDQLTDEQISSVIKTLNEAIEKGPWDKSNFLRVIGKNLTGIRDDFLEKSGAGATLSKAKAEAAQQAITSGEQQEIFVSLYSVNGSDLFTWERIIANLPRQMISRPIYANEEDVQNSIKQKENKVNEGYVGIYVKKTDILVLHQDKTAFDKLGKELLNLKDKTLFLENITRFVHATGVYRFERNRLVKI